ncbi:CBS domain-containing ParB/RepB/Spo0J family partition protein [Methanocella arvoryzae]|uniref:Inosine-5\'-monophosphate dehydrogenase n=1 Tax=Methanocella arvoryzae (strain DSM 22066 / NBRC 105507 / MRE50) TaxID=351160 RepID=Q0W1M4_METAR|nr:CBS domain-containing protein [Methanocella arvoryzae]CAJ37719.1 putative inosine-5\'-monophosphate dehydrogenase [Methanocella arvoryzae MRE50]
MKDKLRVGDYMTGKVVTVSPEDTVMDVIKLTRQTGHDGFPVTSDGKVEGYISSLDMLLCESDEQVKSVMSRNIIVAHPQMEINEVARVIFRLGVSKLPVVDDTGRLVGIITNSDVIRSQIERADPQKVWKLKKTLETVHNIEITVTRGDVNIQELVPTQSKIFADELEGRIYELKKGLAEPIIVIHKPDRWMLADGHHRVVAAKRLGIEKIDAYILEIPKDIKLGMEKTARESGLRTVDDIVVMDFEKHPLIEITERLMMRDRKSLEEIERKSAESE